jgi:hypothetical protein
VKGQGLAAREAQWFRWAFALTTATGNRRGHPSTCPMPYMSTDYVQGNGRLARSGIPSHSVVIYTATSRWSYFGGAPTDVPFIVPKADVCLVNHFGTLVDGALSSTTCSEVFADVPGPLFKSMICGACRNSGVRTTVGHVISRLGPIIMGKETIPGSQPHPPIPVLPLSRLGALASKVVPQFLKPEWLAQNLIAASARRVQKVHARNQELFIGIQELAEQYQSCCGWCFPRTPDASADDLRHQEKECPLLLEDRACPRCFLSGGQCRRGPPLFCPEPRVLFPDDNQHCFTCALPVTIHRDGAIGPACRVFPGIPLAVSMAAIHPKASGRLLQTYKMLPRKVRAPAPYRKWLARVHPSYGMTYAALLFLHIVSGRSVLPDAEELAAEHSLLSNRM